MSTVIRRSLPLVLGGVLAVGLIVLLVVGYSSPPSFNYNGDWSGNRNLVRPDIDKYLATTMGRVTLTIKDRKFDLTEMGIPVEGSVSHEGSGIRLHPETLMLRPLPPDRQKDHPDITVTPQKDGTLLYDNPVAIDGKPLILERKKRQ